MSNLVVTSQTHTLNPTPMQSLCMLRNHRRQWPCNTRYQAGCYPLTWAAPCTGWIRTSLRLAHLFDHLVGDCEKVLRDSESQSVGSSLIDNELNLGGLGNRQISRRFSVE